MSYEALKIIVVSNRLPFVLKRNDKGKLERKSSAGGLVTAVAPVVVACQNGAWVGWPGQEYSTEEPIPESNTNDTTPTAGLSSNKIVPVMIEKKIFDSYYNGCCNETFWPLFHSMPDKAVFSAEHWKAYLKVNELFGEEAIKVLLRMEKEKKDGVPPLVWLHDYHLMVAANTVRQFADTNKLRLNLGFFLHIPFPPWDIFRLFPWADEILQGMLGCDMIGFHTEDYCVNFVDCCHRRLGCRVERKSLLVEHGGRSVRVRPLPIGVPFDRFVSMAQVAPTVLSTTLKIVLGVDRLDYTKGLTNRLKAFEILLQNHPEHLGKVAMIQIAVPSRTDVNEYQELKEEIDHLVGRINGRFTTPMWSPIRYIYGLVSQNELSSFYRDSAVAFVTPFRDGMNLVAKEFVACQIKEPPGVLVISPFAGASETMLEALVCNPYEIEDAAETLHRALTMPDDEKTLRMNQLRRREKLHDVDFWMRSYLKSMGSLAPEEEDDIPLPMHINPLTIDDFDEYLSKYMSTSRKLALLLDYDGTLAPIMSHPDLATLPQETKLVLQKLATNPDIHISIVSGRNVNNVKKMVGIENITYAGNHGLEIIHPNNSKFIYPMPQEYEGKASQLFKALQEQVCKNGAWVENKGIYLTFHYRETPKEMQEGLAMKATHLIQEAGFIAGRAHMAVESKPPITWNKGRASIYILRTAFGLDWSERVRIIYVGDDVTDEDAMQALKGMAVTFRVTQAQNVKTAANWRLSDTNSVLTLLEWVDRHFERRKANQW